MFLSKLSVTYAHKIFYIIALAAKINEALNLLHSSLVSVLWLYPRDLHSSV